MRLLERLFAGRPRGPRFDNHLRLGQWPAVIYAIGDVHGCFEQLLQVERLIAADASQFAGPKLVVLLGDYVDRGPASAEVIAHLLKPALQGFTRITLAGNHEEMMLDALDGGECQNWLRLGGAETLRSYGIDPTSFSSAPYRMRRDLVASHVPGDHLEFLRSLALSVQVEQTVFVHAGIRRNTPVDQQEAQDLLWIRQEFLDAEPTDGLLVVHGHTPTETVEVSAGRIGVDTGAFATGRLSAVRLVAGRDPKIFTTTV